MASANENTTPAVIATRPLPPEPLLPPLPTPDTYNELAVPGASLPEVVSPLEITVMLLNYEEPPPPPLPPHELPPPPPK